MRKADRQAKEVELNFEKVREINKTNSGIWLSDREGEQTKVMPLVVIAGRR